MHSGGMSQLRPISKLEVHLFRNGKGVIDLNAEITHRAFDLGVAEEELNGTQVSCAPVDQGSFCT